MRNPAYASIVGAGANACVLHYRENNAKSRDGDLVLIDAGAEYRGYAADITRTFPVNGRFSEGSARCTTWSARRRRRALAQARPGVRRTKPGTTPRCHAHRRPAALGLLKGGWRNRDRRRRLQALLPAQDRALARPGRARRGRLPDRRRIAAAGTRHGVHPRAGPVHPPMTRGVPAKWRGIGIRIEDDVLVTADGHRVLTGALERSADEVEGLMAPRGNAQVPANASRVRFSGAASVQTTSSSMRMPPKGLNASTRFQSTASASPFCFSSSSSMSMK
jgi:Xaa-Pro aminopeptidase